MIVWPEFSKVRITLLQQIELCETSASETEKNKTFEEIRLFSTTKDLNTYIQIYNHEVYKLYFDSPTSSLYCEIIIKGIHVKASERRV